MKRLKGFTLLELLFVMILTTLIIGIGYFAFSISVKQLHSFKESSKKITEAFQLTMLLNKDFAEAKSILKSNNGLLFKSAMKNQFQYFFTDEYITRTNNSVTDTFFCATQNRIEKFLDKPADSNSGLVDEIYFEIKTSTEQFEIFHAVKSYSADALIQYENLSKPILY